MPTYRRQVKFSNKSKMILAEYEAKKKQSFAFFVVLYN
jgi:hypothetical protein